MYNLSRRFSSDDEATSVDTARMSLTWEELQSFLSLASDAPSSVSHDREDARTKKENLWARIVRSNTQIRQDEWPHPSGVATFWLLRHADAPDYEADETSSSKDPFDPDEPLGGDGPNSTVIAALVQQDNIIFGASVHPALPITAAGSLARAAAAKLAPDRCTCLVSLHGLSAWVRAGERWNDEGLIAAFGREAAEAVRAIAVNEPRPGHAVLGPQTFEAAEEAWTHLANAYVDEGGEVLDEMMMYKSAVGRGSWSIQHLADTDPDYMVEAGGAMAVFS